MLNAYFTKDNSAKGSNHSYRLLSLSPLALGVINALVDEIRALKELEDFIDQSGITH
jgi:hypothetical protein